MFSLTKSPNCPRCGSASTHRSRRRSLYEHILHKLFFISPFRCSDCYSRYFRFRLGSDTIDKPRHHPA